ncbi:hypothetical protein Esti_006443 [Eimeria stiedai]
MSRLYALLVASLVVASCLLMVMASEGENEKVYPFRYITSNLLAQLLVLLLLMFGSCIGVLCLLRIDTPTMFSDKPLQNGGTNCKLPGFSSKPSKLKADQMGRASLSSSNTSKQGLRGYNDNILKSHFPATGTFLVRFANQLKQISKKWYEEFGGRVYHGEIARQVEIERAMSKTSHSAGKWHKEGCIVNAEEFHINRLSGLCMLLAVRHAPLKNAFKFLLCVDNKPPKKAPFDSIL